MDWSAQDRINALNVLATGKTYYAAFFNGDPWGIGTEIPLTRQSFVFNPAVGTPTISQAAQITFPTTTVQLLDATHIGIFDAPTGGTLRGAKQLQNAISLPPNKTCSIAAGVISSTMS